MAVHNPVVLLIAAAAFALVAWLEKGKCVPILQQLKSVLRNPQVIPIDGGERIDAQLPNGEAVYIMKFDDNPAWYVAIGEIPAHGSPPLSPQAAYEKILRAAR